MVQLIPIFSRIFQANDDIGLFLTESLKKSKQEIKNGDILAITSKIVALQQNRIQKIQTKKEKEELIRREADLFFEGKICNLTIKNNILIPNSGIDSSNAGKDQVILWPKNPWKTAQNLLIQIQKKFHLQKIGLIISDSTCLPLRHGVIGIALAWAGFDGISDERGKKDLFGRKLIYTKRAIADMLASSANLVAGEANEKIPLVLIRSAKINFTSKTKNPKRLSSKNCLFAPIYSNKFKQQK